MVGVERVTGATVDVLRVLLAAADPVWGLSVIKATGRKPGTVYPIFDRLESAGWVHSRWEDDPTRSGPRRRYYVLSDQGQVAAAQVVARFDAQLDARSSRRQAGPAEASA
ncbi:PadR family transcriptional regulator [uncultured Amnibacterium sp.]|uniref:PadR family transcriptional regulator n=1 Tax=uncultured Amnibacterium sp. TaxID=1631851 RepID=UPI0035CC1BE3